MTPLRIPWRSCGNLPVAGTEIPRDGCQGNRHGMTLGGERCNVVGDRGFSIFNFQFKRGIYPNQMSAPTPPMTNSNKNTTQRQ